MLSSRLRASNPRTEWCSVGHHTGVGKPRPGCPPAPPVPLDARSSVWAVPEHACFGRASQMCSDLYPWMRISGPEERMSSVYLEWGAGKEPPPARPSPRVQPREPAGGYFTFAAWKPLELSFELAKYCADLKGQVYVGNEIQEVEHGQWPSVNAQRTVGCGRRAPRVPGRVPRVTGTRLGPARPSEGRADSLPGWG